MWWTHANTSQDSKCSSWHAAASSILIKYSPQVFSACEAVDFEPDFNVDSHCCCAAEPRWKFLASLSASAE